MMEEKGNPEEIGDMGWSADLSLCWIRPAVPVRIWQDVEAGIHVAECPALGLRAEGRTQPEALSMMSELAAQWIKKRESKCSGFSRGILDEIEEDLAEYAHEAWSGWMSYMLPYFCPDPASFKTPRVVNDSLSEIPFDPMWHHETLEKIERWYRQMTTKYKDLPESEKESDRVEARKIIARLSKQPGRKEDTMALWTTDALRRKLGFKAWEEKDREADARYWEMRERLPKSQWFDAYRRQRGRTTAMLLQALAALGNGEAVVICARESAGMKRFLDQVTAWAEECGISAKRLSGRCLLGSGLLDLDSIAREDSPGSRIFIDHSVWDAAYREMLVP